MKKLLKIFLALFVVIFITTTASAQFEKPLKLKNVDVEITVSNTTGLPSMPTLKNLKQESPAEQILSTNTYRVPRLLKNSDVIITNISAAGLPNAMKLQNLTGWESPIQFSMWNHAGFSFGWGNSQDKENIADRENHRFLYSKIRVMNNPASFGGFLFGANTEQESFAIGGASWFVDLGKGEDYQMLRLTFDAGMGITIPLNKETSRNAVGYLALNAMLSNRIEMSVVGIFANAPIKYLYAEVFYKPLKEIGIGLAIEKYYPRTVEWGPRLLLSMPFGDDVPVSLSAYGGIGFINQSQCTGQFGIDLSLRTPVREKKRK